MIDSFAAWLRDHMAQVGLAGLVRGVLGILAFGALVSALLGVVLIKAAFVVAVILGVLGTLAVLVVKVPGRGSYSNRVDRMLMRYCDSLELRHGQRWDCKRWVQRVEVRPNGDVHETIALTVIASCDQLEFFSLVNGPGWEWPQKFRSNVDFEVRSAECGHEGGTLADITSAWISRERVKIFVHLRESVPWGSEVSVVAEFEWPAKCHPLMLEGCAEDFVVTFGNMIPYVELVVAVPAPSRVRFDRVGLDNGHQCSLVGNLEREGRMESVLTVRDLPANHKVGMRLELRDAATS